MYNEPRKAVHMEIVDLKRKCMIDGCENLGEWNVIKGGVVYRRKLCCSHHRKLTGVTKPEGRDSYAREVFKKIKCGFCEYCGWEGPCDCHRPNPGRYAVGNMRSTCPNCHRLITRGLMVDKFKIV